MFFNSNPNKVIFELTNRCNLKCRMCDIWKEEPKKDFSLELFKNILSDKKLKKVKCISLTGGEPFMINHLECYYLVVRDYLPKSFINISTNGYFCERIIEFLNTVNVKKTFITISYDGLYSHDRIRGVKGSATKLRDTCIVIKEKFPKLELTLKFTITPLNYKEVFDTAVYVSSLKIPFHIKMIEELNCHQNRQKPSGKKGVFDEKSIVSIVDQLKAVLATGIDVNKRYLRDLIKKSTKKCLTCNWSTKTWFIGLDGKVFLCRKKDSIGNITEYTISELLNSRKHELVMHQIRNCNDKDCIAYTYK